MRGLFDLEAVDPRTVLAPHNRMAIISILLAVVFVVVFLVGGAFSPAGLIIVAGVAIGILLVHRAKRRRGSATQL